jgi:DNA gyrase subunit A
LPIDLKDKVTALLAVADFPSNEFLLMATKAGGIKKTSLDAFDSIRRSGLIAIRLKNNDELVSARRVTDSDEVILASQNGRAVKFKVGKLRAASRSSGGVRGIRLTDDRLVSMNTVFPDAYLLTVTEKGFGKLTSTNSYPAQHRGGKGIQAHRVSDKTGKIAAARIVSKGEGYLVMLSTAGNVECIPIEQVSVQSRKGRGVHIMALAEGDSVVSITVQNHSVS